MKIKERQNQEEKFKNYLISSLNFVTKDSDLYTEIKLKIKQSNSNTFFSDYHSNFNKLFSTNKEFVKLVIDNKIVEHSYYYNDLTTLISYYFKDADIDKIVFFVNKSFSSFFKFFSMSVNFFWFVVKDFFKKS